MFGWTAKMICKELKLKARVYQQYEEDIEKLVKSKLFRLAKNGYVEGMLNSLEERTIMANKLKDRINKLDKKMETNDDPKLMHPFHQSIATWNNLMDSRDDLLNDTPMLQSFHNFVEYNIQKGHAPEIPSEDQIPTVALAALPEMVPGRKRRNAKK